MSSQSWTCAIARAVVLGAAFVLPAPATAQAPLSSAAVAGVVTNPAGDPVADAVVTALDVARNREWTTTTDGQGGIASLHCPSARSAWTRGLTGSGTLCARSRSASATR